MIQHVSWYQDISEEEAVRHTMRKPSMVDILDRLYRLDAEEYPSLTLALDEEGQLFPKLFVAGGSSGYAISLSLGDDRGKSGTGLLSYVNPDICDLPYSYRVIGRTYPGLEIEERFFTSNANLVISLIQHFADTGNWKSGVPFTVEREDDDGLRREYDQILGENKGSWPESL